jgi:hypothetical protein
MGLPSSFLFLFLVSLSSLCQPTLGSDKQHFVTDARLVPKGKETEMEMAMEMEIPLLFSFSLLLPSCRGEKFNRFRF